MWRRGADEVWGDELACAWARDGRTPSPGAQERAGDWRMTWSRTAPTETVRMRRVRIAMDDEPEVDRVAQGLRHP